MTSHPPTLKGNIKHSVCRWCFAHLSLSELCKEAVKIGIHAIDLAGPQDWPTLQAHGLHSSMCNGAEISLTEGWNNQLYHSALIKRYAEMIPKVAKNGYENLICFSGNRNGIADAQGQETAAEGLRKILPIAEDHGITLVMELLNSKIDHPDYQCDRTSWGVELAETLGSEHFKLLYDIYHMQIDEGNVIATIQKYHRHIAHYHTAGVPGRHEIDERQELNYPAIMRAIADTGFLGYVAQEFIPSDTDMLGSLQKAIEICDV